MLKISVKTVYNKECEQCFETQILLGGKKILSTDLVENVEILYNIIHLHGDFTNSFIIVLKDGMQDISNIIDARNYIAHLFPKAKKMNAIDVKKDHIFLYSN